MAYNINNGTKLTSTGKLMATGQKFHAAKRSVTVTPSLQMPLKVSVEVVNPRGMASKIIPASPKVTGTPLPKQHKFNRFSIQSVKRSAAGIAANSKLGSVYISKNEQGMGQRGMSFNVAQGFGKTMAVRQIRKVLAVSKSLEYQGAGVWA